MELYTEVRNMSDGVIGAVLGAILALIFIYIGLSTDTLISSAFLFAGVIVLFLAILFGIIAVLQRR
jgi:hypothetical protein